MDPRPYHYQYRRPRLENPTYQSPHLYESIYHLGAYGKMYPKNEKLNNYPISSSQANIGFKINPDYQRIQRNIEKMPGAPRSGSQTDRYSGENGYHNMNKNQPYAQNYVNGYGQKKQRMPPATSMNNYQSIQYQNQLIDRKVNGYAREKQPVSHTNNHDSRQNYNQVRQPRQIRQQNYNSQRVQTNQPRSYSQDTPSLNSRQSQQKQAYMSNYGTRVMRAMPGKDQDYVYERQQKPYNIISCYPRQIYNAHRVYPKFTLQSKLIETGHYPVSNNPQRY